VRLTYFFRHQGRISPPPESNWGRLIKSQRFFYSLLVSLF